MYTTIPKETDDFEWFDIDELVEEPVDDIDHDFVEQEVEEFNHLQFLILIIKHHSIVIVSVR